MEAELLGILRASSAEQLCHQINAEAHRQSQQALAALSLFTLPVINADATLIVNSKEDYWKLSKKEKLLWQKSKEEERRHLNEEQGINGKALLTKENVEAWRIQGLTFGAIARDIVGCSEYEVQSILKVKRNMPWMHKKDGNQPIVL